MTGPEHYQAAELLIHWVKNKHVASDAEKAEFIGLAQAHATLALAAATALGSRERDGEHDPDGMDYLDRHAWEQAAGVKA